MGRIIILEGTDAGGKTTLARKLETEHGFKYQHHGVPPDAINLYEYYGKHLVDAYESGDDVVFDRHWVGQLVYEPIVRKGPERITPEPFLRLCQGWGIQIVLCIPNWETVRAKWAERNKDGNEWIKDESVLYACYRRWLELGVHYGFQHYTYEKHLSSEVIAGLLQAPRGAKLPPGVIGNPLAKYLVVGDRARGEVDLPGFTSVFDSAYFTDCLVRAGMAEHELAFTNAYKPDYSPRDLKTVLEYLPFVEHVIFTDNLAWGEQRMQLEGNNIALCSLAPHPAYWKQYTSKTTGNFMDIIRGVYA